MLRAVLEQPDQPTEGVCVAQGCAAARGAGYAFGEKLPRLPVKMQAGRCWAELSEVPRRGS